MATKRKKKLDLVTLWEQDETLIALKERYFKLLKKENFGKTPQTTITLDKIELTINARKDEIAKANEPT